jgi:hypothetical protein
MRARATTLPSTGEVQTSDRIHEKQGDCQMTAHRVFPMAVATALTLGVSGSAGATIVHKLLNTVLESGNTGQTLSKGYTTMETASVKCGYSSCTVSMNIMASVANATCTNEWAIVGLVDGNSVDGAPYVSQLPKAGINQVRNWQGQYTVSNGNHTIAFQLYVPCPVNAYQWSVSYMLTTP